MGYRFVFSQMFDVRPRTGLGDLDLEKIEKIEAFLNLRPGVTLLAKETTRIINLKPKGEKILVRGEDAVSGQKFFDPILKKPVLVNPYLNVDYIDATVPDQSEILSVFETIEAVQQMLKKKNILDETAVPLKIETVISEEMPVSRLQEEPQISLKDEALAFDSAAQEEETILPESQAAPQEKKDLLLEKLPDEDAGLSLRENQSIFDENGHLSADTLSESFWLRQSPKTSTSHEIYLDKIFSDRKQDIASRPLKKRRRIAVFSVVLILIFSLIPLFSWANKLVAVKAEVLNSSLAAYQNLLSAKEAILKGDFLSAQNDFDSAQNYFNSANSRIKNTGGWLVYILERIPGFSSISSKTRLVKVGEDLSRAGKNFTSVVGLFEETDINLSAAASGGIVFSENIDKARVYLEQGLESLISAQRNLDRVDTTDLPADLAPSILLLKEQMPAAKKIAVFAMDWLDKFLNILGYDRPKKYLLIFQNNSESRATGGFVGTYGILDINQGNIKNLFIDNIYNPDGQLKEKVVPPVPIQKISTAWSTHDANWFADFPTSAEKISWFYEKTGGPTIDGIISLTPDVIEKLLVLTGPIDMPEYGIVLDTNNFVDGTQYEVEADYDKELNQPKKILTDFAPRFLDKLYQKIKENNLELIKIINQSLKEKDILLYFKDEDLENFVVTQGWGGQILEAKGDYFSVVNSNINGFKSDRMIQQTIKHMSQIQSDGSIIDTLEITRDHQGGRSSYDWYNRVNADYLRVYLPKNTTLLSVQGETKETVIPPIDYDRSGFVRDDDVLAVEQTLHKDEESGTDIFEESGKTVFGNWVYVSPQKTVTIIYRYRLPFKLNMADSKLNFSLLAQKQSGSPGSVYEEKISVPESWQIQSAFNGELSQSRNEIIIRQDLSEDREFEFEITNVK